MSTYALSPDGAPLWSAATGSGHAPAIAADGSLYLGVDKSLVALDAGGAIKWEYKIEPGNDSLPFTAAAIGAGGVIYIGCDKDFYAINPDGTQQWVYHAGETDRDAIPGAPAIGGDGTLYFVKGDSEVPATHKLVALNPDGTLKWEYYANGYFFESAVTVDADGTAYVGIKDTYSLYAVNPDGSLKWTFDDPHAEVGPVAIGADGTLYFGVDDGSVYALGSGGG
jgi:outer membrane protein assembly factor BamB